MTPVLRFSFFYKTNIGNANSNDASSHLLDTRQSFLFLSFESDLTQVLYCTLHKTAFDGRGPHVFVACVFQENKEMDGYGLHHTGSLLCTFILDVMHVNEKHAVNPTGRGSVKK